MTERDPRNKGGLFGYEVGYGKIPELRIQELLENNLPEMVRNTRNLQNAYPNDSEVINYPIQQQINIEIQDLTKLEERLEIAQQELSNNIAKLGILGQRALVETTLQTEELKQLNKQAQEAYLQRNKALELFEAAVIKLQQISQQINLRREEAKEQANTMLSSMTSSFEDQTQRLLGGLGSYIGDLQQAVEKTGDEIVGEISDLKHQSLWRHVQIEKRLSGIKHAIVHSGERQLHIEARIMMNNRQNEKALKLLEIAHEGDITNPDIWYSLAICNMELGNYNEAFYYIKCILKIAQKGHRKDLARRVLYNNDFEKIMDYLKEDV